jgi:ligand-binding sensor domain-containing protein/serine phosphatase RsbU (regulator of sigma subunit)
MIKRHLFLILLLITTTFRIEAQSPHFELFKVMKNKKDVKVNTLFQDKSGFIWIGTNQGIVKYNGIEFSPFTTQNNLSSNEITAITQDSLGIIWVGNKNGSICTFDGETFTPFNPEEGLGTSEISDFLVTKSHTIWFSTFGEGVYYWGGKNRKRIYNINADDGLLDNYTYSIVQGDKANIYIATDKGICVYDTIKCSIVDSITMSDGLPDNIVKHLCFTPDKKLWIAMEDGGICNYDVETKKFHIISDWMYGSINNFVIVNSTEFWVSTKHSGIVRIKLDSTGKPWYKEYGKTQGLTGLQTQSVFLDQEHNIWFGTKEGLMLRKNNNIEFLDEHDSFNYKNIISLAFDKQGSIWMATQDGLLKVDRSESGRITIKKVLDNSKTSFLPFISVFCDSEGFIWVGTYGFGVYRINPKDFTYKVFTTDNGLANNNVISISGSKDSILFSTLGGGVSICNIKDSKKFSTLSIDNGLTSNYIYSTFVDSKNKIWFGTDGGGIACMTNGVVKKCEDSRDSLFSHVFYSITEDQLGRIWFSSADKGIYIYDGLNFKTINEINGLRNNAIHSMARTIDGKIVLVSNEGIDVYDIGSETFDYWGDDDRVAYQEPNLNATVTDSQGNIWIGTQQGIMILTASNDNSVQQEPNLQITDRLLYSKPIPKSKTTFSYTQNYFTFHYIGLWYKSPGKLFYRYKLEGADMEWSAPTRNLQMTYSNLSSGNYRFVVEVSYIPGKWISNPNASFSFTIEPPFYFTWWFISGAIILMILGVFSFIKYRIAKLERDKDILEEEVKKRTHEIQMQKEEIETQRDEIEEQHQYVTKQRDQIAIQNRDIKASIEYASRIQQAMLPPADLIDNYFKDYFILFNPRDIVSGDFYYFNLRDGKIIFSAVDCTGHGVPGAFMSMLGQTLLNDIVANIPDISAAKILNELRIKIKIALRQKGFDGETRDGMDISLCVFDSQNRSINYAGAYNPLFIVRGGELLVYKADKMPIGVFIREDDFTDQYIDLVQNDMIYIFSDGYHDQLGGVRNAKFLVKNFRDLILQISSLPAEQQKQKLVDKINEWKDGYPQTDDMLVVGIKI